MDKPFKFKQFTIHQERCAMKIGTDGVLLGAWASVDHEPFNVLDIGAGTGLLSLMLAQRCQTAQIEAIEIDEEAFEQCVDNFEASPWSDRVFCYHASLVEYVQEVDERYDLIICNPPFYSDTYKTRQESRNKARFQDALPFEHLLHGASVLLSETGIFSVILPYKEISRFIRLAQNWQLHPNRILNVKGDLEVDIKRSLIEFSRQKKPLNTSELTIENGRHNYTDQYINLTKDFYLKM